ncbi:efflux RND transporter periplasmic adaptor subunit [Porticoccaceae bacterium]|nr:efflux RND transporter periplasmic adaptor subunit [Porticoccaceae bacterium]
MNNNLRLALIFALALLVWFFSGLLRTTEPSGTLSSEVASTLTKVLVVNSVEQVFRPIISLRAKTKANRDVQVLAQVSGKISATLAEEGSYVTAGQGICQIDAEDRHLRLAQAEASLENANIAYRGALRLKSAGYQSELAISQAKATQATARTNLERARLDVQHLQIKAPFDGIVESRPVEIGDLIMPGQLCARVVELSPLKVEALVAETEIGRLTLGDSALVNIAGQDYQGAVISYLAYQADRATKGYRVEATMPNPNQAVRAGISARLNILAQAIPAHLIPASSVLLDDEGETAVRILSQESLVESVRVTAVGEAPTGIWVTGLDAEVILVVVGQNYIIEGELVNPSYQVSPLN